MKHNEVKKRKKKAAESPSTVQIPTDLNSFIGQSQERSLSPEEYAQEIAAFYQSIIANMPNHVYWLDRNCVLQGGNNKLAHFFGLKSASELAGLTYEEMSKLANWTEGQGQSFKNAELEVMSTGVPRMNVEEPAVFVNGQKRYFMSSKVPLHNKKGEIIGVLGITTDVTDLKEAKEKAEASEKKSEASKFIMTELISNLGHDFTTPLADIGSVAYNFDLYKDELPQFSAFIDLLLNRYEACELVRKRFIDGTSISRLEITNVEKVYITEVLLNLEKKFREDIQAKHLKLIIQPIKPKTDDFVVTDREKFTAILDEFLENAIKFTEKGQITINASKDKEMILIQVTDTGIGIPVDKLDYIFEQYTKISRSNKHGVEFKGVGAGLFLVRIMAHILKATITVTSELNKGSTFTLTMPIYYPEDSI